MATSISLYSECLGLVLAGGRSQRMGQNKALLPHPQGDQLTLNMAEFSRELLLTAGLTDVACSGERIGGIPDLFEHGGPLSGILSAVEKYQPQALLVIPCDMPFMTAKALNVLRVKGELSQCAAYYDHSSLPLYLPVNGLIQQTLQTRFNSAEFKLSGRGPSFKEIINLARGQSIPCQDKNILVNTNTPQEWQHACQQLKAPAGKVN